MRRTKEGHNGATRVVRGSAALSKKSGATRDREARPKRETLRILVADDHGVVRRGVRSLIDGHPEWEICGEVGNGQDAVAEARRLRPDIVLMDITMPGLNGLDATRAILEAVPETKVLILTMHESEQVVREVLDAGAHGYILKSDADSDLLNALGAIRQGRPFFASKVSQIVLEGYLHPGPRHHGESGELTPRQREVVALLSTGKSNKEVAAALGISIKTAETHRSTIMRRLKLGAFSDLVRYAVRERIIEP